MQQHHSKPLQVRMIQESDAAAALEVYKPYVQNTAITFEYEVPSLEEFTARIRTNTAEYPWLVCTEADKIVGYAYGSRHRYKTAYQWSPESTIYIAETHHGRGIAKALYRALFDLLKLQGYVNVFAGVALPNAKSEKLHRNMGFEVIGDFRNIGYKLGAWHDVRWMQLSLVAHTSNPPDPKSMAEIMDTAAFHETMLRVHEMLK